VKKLNSQNKKVAVALSGGVDSGVAAALLIKEGYQCTGFHLHLWSESIKDKKFENKYYSTESLEAARKTAHQLGMTFQVIDFSQLFKKKVVDYFLKTYAVGLTPNPCVFCNKFIKFGELLNYIRKLDFDYLATGHYARVMLCSPDGNFDSVSDSARKIPSELTGQARERRFTPLNEVFVGSQNETSQNLSGSLYYSLLMGVDKFKDQSYFLYNLTQCQLKHVLFPIGDYQKKEVVAMAKRWQLPVAHRPESQEICFLPENDYRPFLKRHLQDKIKPGEVVDMKRKVIGSHQGLPLYTIGQRHGFEVKPSVISHRPSATPPFYVIGKNIEENRLVVGFGKETERKEFWVKDINWINPLTINHQSLTIKCQVRIRHQGELLSCEVRSEKWKEGKTPRTVARRDSSEVKEKVVKVTLDEGERGIAPGQSAVFYLGEEVLGGGIIGDYPLTKEKKNDTHKLSMI